MLDGGLATELEKSGHSLNDSLWSARLLRDAPAAIQATHLAFLEAGADIITSSSYQATILGFTERLGISRASASKLIASSVNLAFAAREEYIGAQLSTQRPLVAAGIGPLGAFLADGSEYTGAYNANEHELFRFHHERWNLLRRLGPDLILCETIPKLEELRVLAKLADESEMAVAISVNCRDAFHLSDGTPMQECVQMLASHNIAAVGVNCVSPNLAIDAVRHLNECTDLPLLAYPNSGEAYLAEEKTWTGESNPNNFQSIAVALREAGCQIIGGCCRTTPSHIAAVAKLANLPKDH